MLNKRLRDYTKEKLWTTKEVADMLDRRGGETLKEVGEWLDKQHHYPSVFGTREPFVALYDSQIEALKRGEMPK